MEIFHNIYKKGVDERTAIFKLSNWLLYLSLFIRFYK